ncbi:hypothetical protein GGS24DRAFT_321244 [Hypoxylon argillaceum]|nr:hypothetical protein GGS24DRAFT_321244 [Hypoxylon argillaceum]KAI1148085.1 hypothetical protein F4825DRAFT_114200 [Nemania diffusa]
MSVGTLHTKVVLDEPGKMHCGNLDPVLGHISIRYSPGQKNVSAELFGPLKVFVILHGRAKTKVWKSNGQSTAIYRGRAQLFSQRVLVHDGTFRALPGDTFTFPFSLFFPEVTNATDVDRFGEDSRFICRRNQPLPPSFQNSSRTLLHRYEAFVEYRVGVDVLMPQLQVDVNKPTKYLEPVVYYERPRASQPANGRPYEWRGIASVRNELLLPEADRPSGFKEKTKALFGAANFPTYAFDWVCLAPKDVHLGQPSCFEVRIKPREHECTAILIPEVRLKNFSIEIVAHTQVRAHQLVFSSPGSQANYTICQMKAFMDTDEPFSKANDNTKIINTKPLGSGSIGAFSSSFATHNISQAYTIKISLAFEITDKVKHIDKEYGVTVHPPLEIASLPEAAVAGPSSQALDTEDQASNLPPYEPLPPYDESPTSQK